MLRPRWSRPVTVLVDVVAWAVLHSATGYAAHRLDDRRLARDGWLLRARRFEDGGRWYRRRLRIHRWKDRVPEAGALFPGGTSKRTLPGRDPESLELFVRETRRAELAHWWCLAASPVLLWWNPPVAVAPLLAYGVAANAPFILIQRHNRFRTQAVLARLRARQARP